MRRTLHRLVALHAKLNFDSDAAADIWLQQQKNSKLEGFLPLAFTAQVPDMDTTGLTMSGGSLVFLNRMGRGIPQIMHTVAHELVHNLMDVADEHERDGNDNQIDDEADDKKYLMYPFSNVEGDGKIIFTNTTRSRVSFFSAQYVTGTGR